MTGAHHAAFGEAVEARHRRIDPDDWEDVYVVGDVHGCPGALGRLVDRLDPGPADLLVFVGDLVRKGPDSAGVVRWVRERDNAVSVLGNNERKVNEGEATLPGLSAADREYLRSLPVAVSWEGELVVHGGIDPRKPLADHTVEDLTETRSLGTGGSYRRPFWFERYRGPPRVFFGHTVLERPVDREWAVGLDTGCVYGGALTAYDWRAGEFVSVPGGADLDRSEDSIVVPRTAPEGP
jgi:serine/threonine protein phosphatase 1